MKKAVDRRIAVLESELAALKAHINMDGSVSEAMTPRESASSPTAKKKHATAKIGGVCFYLLIILAILAAFTLSGDGKPREIAGYSVMRVLTDSMMSVMPRGSIVLIQRTDPADIVVGDDVTYSTADGKLVTHRVEDIYPDYNGTGYRGFVTKGVNNPVPDPDIVYGVNIVGKVIWHNNTAGQAIGWLRANLTAALVIAGMIPLLFLLICIARQFFKPAGRLRNQSGYNTDDTKSIPQNTQAKIAEIPEV